MYLSETTSEKLFVLLKHQTFGNYKQVTLESAIFGRNYDDISKSIPNDI